MVSWVRERAVKIWLRIALMAAAVGYVFEVYRMTVKIMLG